MKKGEEQHVNLSQIETRWSLLYEARPQPEGTDFHAQRELVERYAGAVHRYLLCVTSDPEMAADLTQEFVLRFLRGDFHRADPQLGRFRNYLKVAVLNLLTDARRKLKKAPRPLQPGDDEELTAPSSYDREFLDCLRDEILSRAWARLGSHQEKTGQPFFSVLNLRAEEPKLRSHEMATRLSNVLGKEVNAGWVRQNLRRAREKFVEIVQLEITQYLGANNDGELDDEIREIGLWSYCGK